jgi:hypothetical protein
VRSLLMVLAILAAALAVFVVANFASIVGA